MAASGKKGTGYPLKQAYQETLKEAAKRGWAVKASYKTFTRRWADLPAARRRTLEMGAQAAAASLIQTQPRSVTGMHAMHQVELDGKEFGVLVRWPDGAISCPWVIMYCDRASSKVLSWSISTSENAEAAREATITLCEEHGIPDWVLTDNGAAFNGRVMAGGLTPLYRTKKMESPDWDVPGVLNIYGIKLQNTAPGAPRGKLPESLFSALRHVKNAPEFFGAQRSGPNDIPNPNPVPVEFALFKAVFEKKIREFNSMTDSRAQGLRKGESRNQAFVRMHDGRPRRDVTPLMRRSVPMMAGFNTWTASMAMRPRKKPC
jgi:transposase InsO family protein